VNHFKPELTGIQLQHCCIDSLEIIRVKLEAANYLERFMIPAVFVSLFISPSKGSALTTATSIYGTDWELLAIATNGIGPIAKSQVRDISDTERLKHNGVLRNFWDGVHDSFL
jgi:hypothetical protein